MNWMLWALLSALFAGLTAVLAKIGVSQVDPTLATAIRTTVILGLTWALVGWLTPAGQFATISLRGWGFLIASGLTTGLSWICYFRALRFGPVSQVAPIDKLSVVVAIVLGLVFLGEKLKPQEAIGAGMMVLGAIIMIWK